MIIHCGKSLGYVESVHQTITGVPTDKPKPLFVFYWEPNKQSSCMCLPRKLFMDWLNKNLGKYQIQLFQAEMLYIGEIEQALKTHGVKQKDIEVFT